ncbi:hypothetical protein BKA69DRAFT_1052406 [Paraphysoderma sedebokerense]|nr:hypothetical protein BKA69DRAFT_1052406 [Paraphysoderma sedebokerense]
MVTTYPPNQTIYVNNLNDKIQKDVLKKSLYCFFSPYGRIADIVALKTMKMRGQAFIVFEDIPSATAALRDCQGKLIFDKPMQIGYAKTRSFAVGGPTKDQIGKPASLTEQLKKRSREDEEEQEEERENEGVVSTGVNDVSKPKEKKQKTEDGEEDGEADEMDVSDEGEDAEDEELPNKILFLQNLPEDATEEMLAYLFQQYPGYKETRLIPGRSDLAFVEYETDEQAKVAKDVLNGFKLTQDKAMKVGFAKQ